MTILARIKQTGDDGQESSETVLEKYYEAKRELETLKQRVGSEYEDEIERLTATKKSLEKKVRKTLRHFSALLWIDSLCIVSMSEYNLLIFRLHI